ncbi:MAG TPA: aldo/keto reductase, partial [Acidimicrobiales bacterium]|nr:aldo/keto reductase [Acidimicrobiales bacterium]
NFSADQLRAAQAAAGDGGFASVQNHYNLLNRADEADVLPLCRETGIAYLPYFPLASGVLTGKYHRGQPPPEGTRLERWGERAAGLLTEQTFDTLDALADWAGARGHGLLEVAIARLTAEPAVASVIAGATTVGQVEANAAAGDTTLTADEVARIDELTREAAEAASR